MYFDFEDYRPDITPVGRAISWREGVLLSIIVHLVVVILILVFPKLFPFDAKRRAGPRRAAAGRSSRTTRDSCSFSRASIVRRRSRRRTRRAVRPGSRGARARARAEARRTRCRSRAATRPSASRSRRRRGRARPGARSPTAAGPAGAERRPSAPQTARIAVGDAAARSGAAARRRRTAPSGRSATCRADRSATRCATCSATRSASSSTTRAAAAAVRSGDSVRHQGRRVRPVDPPLHRAGEAQLVHPVRGDVDEGARRRSRSTCTRTARSPICTVVGPCAGRRVQQRRVRRAVRSNPTQPLPPEYPADKAFFTVTFFYNETPPR